MSVRGIVRGSAPVGATVFGFLVGAATATSLIPVFLYKVSSQFWTAVIVALCGVVVAPFAGLVGVGLTNRLKAWGW